MRDLRAGQFPHARSTAALAGIALALAACAGGPGGVDGPPGGGPLGGPGGGGLILFVSPFGEAFRSTPDQPWPVADWFMGADEDLDGVLTYDEFAADGLRWFAHLDADRSGRLDQAELADYETALRAFSGPSREPGGPRPEGGPPHAGPGGRERLSLAPPQSRGGGGRGGPPGGGGAGRPRSGPQGYGAVAEAGFFGLPQPVKAADVNVDQRVTAEEWATMTRRWFLQLDTDQDGRLTLAALPKTPLQRRFEAARR